MRVGGRELAVQLISFRELNQMRSAVTYGGSLGEHDNSVGIRVAQAMLLELCQLR